LVILLFLGAAQEGSLWKTASLSSNGSFVTDTEAKIIVSIKLLPLQRQKNRFGYIAVVTEALKMCTGCFVTVTNDKEECCSL
jgi:hypothetical protein